MVMTLSGVGGILGCSRFITGTFREDYGEDALDAEYQLSNDLGLFLSAEETGEEASSQNVVDVLQETLQGKGLGDGDISKDFNLLFDVLVGEEESSTGACAKIV